MKTLEPKIERILGCIADVWELPPKDRDITTLIKLLEVDDKEFKLYGC